MILIITIPFINFIICAMFGRKIGIKGVKIITATLFLIAYFINIYLLIITQLGYKLSLSIINWIKLPLLIVEWEFSLDLVSSSMLLLILTVSSFVHLYSFSYMSADPHQARFISYLSLFTFFMIILVTSQSLLVLFIGWEGVGLCSFLLINFWFQRQEATKAAFKAMYINKIGDLAFLIATGLIVIKYYSIDFSTLFPLLNYFHTSYINNCINIFLIVAITSKSAQVGLHSWLPDAMEGPTPVSALIHAATMVTAGVFLLIRLSPVFMNNSLSNIIIITLGSLTCLISATIGLFQNDIKKIIAYSTCSQLGFMVLICGFEYYYIGLFHLINHGFFKALLFLSSGLIIHTMQDEQDIRKYGNINAQSKLGIIIVLIGTLAIIGFPFLAGYYSKDLLLEILLHKHLYLYPLLFGILATFCTSFYSFRLFFLTFIRIPTKSSINLIKSNDLPLALISPLILLSIGSITIGWFLSTLLFPFPNPVVIPSIIKYLPLIVTVLGFISIVYILQVKREMMTLNKILYNSYRLLIKTYYYDNIINKIIHINALIKTYNNIYLLIDNHMLEYKGPTGIRKYITPIINTSSNYYTGIITKYFYAIIFFSILILSIV